MFIPYQSILIPLVQTLQAMHLYGSIPGLILVHVVYGIPITTLIFRNYYATVPTELVEASRIDGAFILWHLSLDSLPYLHTRLCRRDDLAVHFDLERFSVRRDACQ
jgi:ABC-type maltose transport system permease subunit